jgi:MinD-like ATPase involved in chromosome partitioning or flagellar assembly
MTAVAIGSVKGSPGATTTVLAMAATWPADRKVLVIEADSDGGVVAARCRLRLEPGISTLAAAWRHSPDPTALSRHTQALPGGVPAVVAPSDPDQATRALAVVAQRFDETLEQLDVDVLIDVGRLRTSSPTRPIVDAASQILVVARPRLDELQAAAPRLRALRHAQLPVSLLLIGERPYSADEVATALDVPVLGTVADDPAAAGMFGGLGGSEQKLRRSHLVRSVRGLIEQLTRASAPTALTHGQAAPVAGRFSTPEPIDIGPPR